MRINLLALIGSTALAAGTQALAETCTIEITGPHGQWKFVHVYDVATGKMVLGHAIRSGHSREVTVSGHQVRVDWKLAGDAHYHAGAATECKAGHTIKV
jgi:hypothetical protein